MIAQESKGKDRRRRIARFGSELEKRLSGYASAAAAAGVSLLALTTVAQAKIVYTATNTPIPFNGGPVLVDLNRDGIADFFLSNGGVSFSDGGIGFLRAGAESQDNAIWGRGTLTWSDRKLGPPKAAYSSVFASALRPGFTVGPTKSYFRKGKGWLMALVNDSVIRGSQTHGQWGCGQSRYLGLKFVINGQTHYGWAREQYKQGEGPTLTGYAYETIANKPIITGKTKGADVIATEEASLGCLAQGASGIPVWRKSAGRWQPAVH